MKLKVSLYDIPLPPGDQAEESYKQARVQSDGTIRLNEICCELRELGVNSAQIKAVLDAVAKYMGKSLISGYNFELEGIGTFSLSLHHTVIKKETGERIRVNARGVNFRCNKELKRKVREAEFEQIKQSPKRGTPEKRRDQMIKYLERNGHINITKYAALNDCSRYQARKEMEEFVKEGILISSGLRTHKIYELACLK